MSGTYNEYLRICKRCKKLFRTVSPHGKYCTKCVKNNYISGAIKDAT